MLAVRRRRVLLLREHIIGGLLAIAYDRAGGDLDSLIAGGSLALLGMFTGFRG
jgi:hypothetical protein